MTELNEEEKRLRRFLLGELSEDERQHVEELFLVDQEFKEKVLAAQDDLIEEYAEGSLSDVNKRQVVERILSTPQQRQKLKIARLIKKYVAVEMDARSPRADGKIKQPAHGYIGMLGLRRPYVFIPVAAVLLIALGFGAMKLIEVRRLNEQRARAQSLHLAVERELAQLNNELHPGTTELAAASIVLSPVFVRDLKATPKVSPPAEPAVVKLWLVLVRNEYETYRAVFQKLDDPAEFTVPNLHAQNTTSGKAVQLNIPARLLTRGDYQVRLNGVGGDGTLEEIGEYNFQVVE